MIGIFHPPMNTAGGAEYVAVNIANVLKQKGLKVIVMSGEKINLRRISERYSLNIRFDKEFIFPYKFVPSIFPFSEIRVYFNMFGSLLLKNKCKLVIDTYTNLVFPWTDIIYFHTIPVPK